MVKYYIRDQTSQLKGNQTWILIGRTDADVETPVFGHLMWTADSLEKSLMLGKIKGRRRRGHQRMRWLDGITDKMDTNLGKLQGMVRDREAWRAAIHGAQRVGHNWETEQHDTLIFLTCHWDQRQWIPSSESMVQTWGLWREGKTHCKYCRVTYSPLCGKPRVQSVLGTNQKDCSWCHTSVTRTLLPWYWHWL